MAETDRELLEKLVFFNDELDDLESRLAEFNIFEALGAVRQEVRHSAFLAFVLDPRQNHGLGDTVLKGFLKQALRNAAAPPLSIVAVDVADLGGVEVIREWNGIDILTVARDIAEPFVCAVENKIDSGEHDNQLLRYRKTVGEQYPELKQLFVFLTPDGGEPSDEAFAKMSYTEVAGLIESVERGGRSTLGRDVGRLLAHYATMLRRHIVAESDVTDLCRAIYRKHKRALDLIFEHRPDRQSELSDYVVELIAADAASGIELDHRSKAYIHFVPSSWDSIPALLKGRDWTKSGRMLMFEVVNTGDLIDLKLLIGPGPQVVRLAIHNAALEHPDALDGLSKSYSPQWLQLFRLRMLSRKEYEDEDLEPARQRIEHHWKKFVKDELPKLQEFVAGITWPAVGAEATE